MPIRSSFRLARDARGETDGRSDHSSLPPRSVCSPKFHPFSRIQISRQSNSFIAASPSFLSTNHCTLSTQSSFLNTNTNHSKDRQHPIQSHCNHSNPSTLDIPSHAVTDTHHSRFASTLSKTPPSASHPTTSSRAPRIPPSSFRPPVSAVHRVRCLHPCCVKAWSRTYH